MAKKKAAKKTAKKATKKVTATAAPKPAPPAAAPPSPKLIPPEPEIVVRRDPTARELVLAYIEATEPCSYKSVVVACSRHEPKVPAASLHVSDLVKEGLAHYGTDGLLWAGPRHPSAA